MTTETQNLIVKSGNIILGTPEFFANTCVITGPTPASRTNTYTIPDTNSDCQFIMASGTQNITGIKTFTASPNFPAAPYFTQSSGQIVIQPSGSGPYYILNASSNPSVTRSYSLVDVGGSCEFVMGIRNGSIYTTGQSLVGSQSGHYITIQNTGIAYTITLPSATIGYYFEFYVGGTLSNAVTIASTTSNVFGSVVSSDGTAVSGGNLTSAKTAVILGTTAGKGDRYTFYSDGVSWYLTGVTNTHGSVTFS